MQLLEKVEGQQAWRVRQLMALAMCQAEGPRPEEAPKTLAKAMDLALSAGLPALKVGEQHRAHDTLARVAQVKRQLHGSTSCGFVVLLTQACGQGTPHVQSMRQT
jgi:hypothetical protein